MKYSLIAALIFLFCSAAQGQPPFDLQEKKLAESEKKIQKFSERRKRATEKYLSHFNKSEQKFLQRLCKKDPQMADVLFLSHAQGQQRLNRILNGTYKNHFDKPTSIYNSYNDTLFNSIECAGDANALLALKNYKKQLANEEYIKDYMRHQKLTIKKVAVNLPNLKNSFKRLDRYSYYYIQQLNDYDEWFGKTDKLEEKAMELLKRNTDFSKFMEANSSLSSITKIPSDWGKNIEGLQTNSTVKDLQQKSLNGLTDEGKELVKENLTEGSSLIRKMKSELPQLANAADVPDFKPNPLKTKRKIDRLHFGFDFQFDNRTSLIPKGITTGLNGEYQLNPLLSIGTGIAYHASFNKTAGENKNSLSSSYTLRSYIDYKLKSILFLTMNYERINLVPFHRPKTIESALIGLKIKYSVKGKLAPSISLMYDLLYDKHVPETPMIVYRVGWII